jgi:outer membrane protein OmpA-like peptidoglycan-associated protein/flagellar hook assembly protein FlgD
MKKGLLIIGMVSIVLSAALPVWAAPRGTGGPRPFIPVDGQTASIVTSEDSIQTEQTGLAPNGDKLHSTIDFSLFFSNQDGIKNWKVEMVKGSDAQKLWSGDADHLPRTLTWNGNSDAGTLAPEGTYIAKLTVDYGANSFTAQSNSFILDVSPPSGSVTSNPEQFTPDSTETVQPVAISIVGSSAVAKMDSWSLDILDANGRAFRSYDGKWSHREVQWDGKSASGAWVAPGQSYIAEATLRDEFGNSAQVYAAIAVSNLPRAALRKTAPQTFSITPGSKGFSPTGDRVMDTMKLAVSYGPRGSVNSWKVEIVDSDQQVQKTFSGDGLNLAMTVIWDGRSDAGSLAAEGTYTARLSVDYGSAFNPGSTTSTPFVLDITPPTGFITLSDALFSPIEASPTITIGVNASSPVAKIDSWRMEIDDPENHLFKTFEAQWPTKSAVWDGKGFEGDLVLSAEDYPVVVKVRDEFGNVGELTSVVPVDILMLKTATGFRILSSRIFFKPYTADYQDVRPELAAQNMKRLADMATKLRKFSNYKITLVGHAVSVYWDNTARSAKEERDVLLPLSKARAEAVDKAMIDRGLNAARFTSKGVGDSDQLVPDSNLLDRWQNRRVAFFLDK